jgi:hypothetical protein
MSTAQPLDWDQVAEAVSVWPPDRRILLIQRLLDSLIADIAMPRNDALAARAQPGDADRPAAIPVGRRPVVGPDPRLHRSPEEMEETLAGAIGRLKNDRPPPTDDEVRRILDDARWEKYR